MEKENGGKPTVEEIEKVVGEQVVTIDTEGEVIEDDSSSNEEPVRVGITGEEEAEPSDDFVTLKEMIHGSKGNKKGGKKKKEQKTESTDESEKKSNEDSGNENKSEKEKLDEEAKSALKFIMENLSVDDTMKLAEFLKLRAQQMKPNDTSSKDIVIIEPSTPITESNPVIVSRTYSPEYDNLVQEFKSIRIDVEKEKRLVTDTFHHFTNLKTYVSYLDTFIKFIDKVCLVTKDITWLRKELEFLKKDDTNFKSENVDTTKYISSVENHQIVVPNDMAGVVQIEKDFITAKLKFAKKVLGISYKHNIPDKFKEFKEYSKIMEPAYTKEMMDFNAEMLKKIVA